MDRKTLRRRVGLYREGAHNKRVMVKHNKRVDVRQERLEKD